METTINRVGTLFVGIDQQLGGQVLNELYRYRHSQLKERDWILLPNVTWSPGTPWPIHHIARGSLFGHPVVLVWLNPLRPGDLPALADNLGVEEYRRVALVQVDWPMGGRRNKAWSRGPLPGPKASWAQQCSSSYCIYNAALPGQAPLLVKGNPLSIANNIAALECKPKKQSDSSRDADPSSNSDPTPSSNDVCVGPMNALHSPLF